MIVRYCDVCGEEITDIKIPSKKEADESRRLCSILGKRDVCCRCSMAAAKINPFEILMKEWRKAAGIIQENPGEESRGETGGEDTQKPVGE